MKKRIITITLALIFIIGVLGAFALTSGAQSTVSELSITDCNLSFSDSVYIKYAVKSNVSDVELLVWTSPEAEYTYGTQDDVISEYYIDNELGGKFVFDYKKLAAKQMTDVLYVRAYARVDGVDYYSEVNKYSILQYAYNMLGKTAEGSQNEELKTLLTEMLEYGAAAQEYFEDYKADRLATADWYQVKLKAGLLDDGCTHGLYLPGDKVTMTAPATDGSGVPFSHWANSNGDKIAETATYELTVGNKNEVYTPVYAESVSASTGLEFDSNGDGTCVVISMGDCTDTELVIPAKSPDGDTVIGIEASAFAGEAITSVSFPSTIKEIGRRAFYSCTALTDVYYDGTEEEWNNVYINATGNDAIVNATKHFKTPAVVTFTVIFKDYDGTTLKTEAVESGNSATAPEAPAREDYTFMGWDKSFDNVTEDLVVTATYAQITGPTIIIGNASGSVGGEAEVVFNLVNSPKLYAMTLQIAYDDTALELISEESGEAMSGFTYTKPSSLKDGSNFMWYANDPATANGTVLKLVFKIKDSAAVGSYSVSMTCDPNNTYDADENDVELNFVDGIIVVTE